MSTTRTFEVPDISCGHCQQAIESRLRDEPGVETVSVTVDDRKVHVEGPADDQAIVAAIADAGYEGASRV